MGNISISSYFSYAKILSCNAVYNAVVGGRGIGKTFGGKKKAIKDGITKGFEFVLLRRYKTELAQAKATFFEDVQIWFPEYSFRVEGNKAQYAIALPDDFEELEAKQQKEVLKARKWTTIGYFMSLSSGQSYKGSSYPRVRTIIFDEFIIEKGQSRYLPAEVSVLNNFYITIDRYRGTTRVIMLSNSVSIDNPYFIAWEIDPDEADENGIIVKFKGSSGLPYIAVQFADSTAFNSEAFKTRFGQFVSESDPEYADYAIGNTFQDNHKLLIEGKDYKADYLYSIETAKGTFSVWTKFLSGVLFIQAKLPKKQRMFTLIASRMSEDKLFLDPTDPVLRGLRTAWRGGMVKFDSAQTRNAMLEVFKR